MCEPTPHRGNIDPLARRDNCPFSWGSVKFVLDDHLGKLARLLRTLGFDTTWCRTGDEARIVEASAAGRLFVTRDSAWTRKTLPGPKLILTASSAYEQLRAVLAHCALTPSPTLFLSRCLICNEVTRPVEKSEIAELLPPYVRATQDRFRLCPGCRRIYWEGSHVQAIRAALEKEGI